ncbi:hypothetical protein HBH98_158910 [Parastagonospora nodorum]|nr:hypothetical protein HBH51_031550 [Parastagonospora nodorum]KAH4274777.1 hypothetical protein HBI03_000430 [Parastagonospora nodorum]KAH4276245.1 hypothetical protein HBI04_119690 [Parastagonospora nodorum]KAH4296259.1 hypothetical protein HBI01_146260 [Parastagonospora nodorum]KAH4305123.1 hypothetical protein HBI02_128570 [Parastagonospora nodorum]
MTRWHGPFCITPDVFVTEDRTPSCQACGKTCPSTEVLISQQEGVATSWTLPPDEPPGQMNLRWPKSVPYYRANQQIPLTENVTEDQRTAEPPPTSSSIYGKTLKNDEIRLACLSAVSTEDSPLHLSLDTYADDDHPEYECTSYSWATDDGDDSLCCPIYVGKFWDVQLQTKNCFAMLRFLHPWRGIRILWVDAVCINQRNTEEREAQVSKMRSIYDHCSRTVVYLGEDLVTSSRRFPTSLPLDTLGKVDSRTLPFPAGHRLYGTNYTLRDLLSRRYFSRLWIIQELVVSDQVIIRIGDVDFRANARIAQESSKDLEHNVVDYDWLPANTNILHNTSENVRATVRLHKTRLIHRSESFVTAMSHSSSKLWSNASESWLQHLAHKSFPPDIIKDVTDILKLTANSSASDPRDLLFGVLPLLVAPGVQADLNPEYSLSMQQFMIGLFSYILTREKRYWFLGNADAGMNARQRIERGLPSWIPDYRKDGAWRRLFQRAPNKPPSFNGKNYRRPFPVFLDEANRKWLFHRDRQFSWPPDAIGAANGALIISAAHIFSFENGILAEGRHGPLFRYAIAHPWRTSHGLLVPSRLLLITPENLDLQPDKDHLYIPVSMPQLYLILRRTNQMPVGTSFELVTACVRLFDRRRPPKKADLEFLANKEHQNAEDWSKVGAVPSIASLQLTQYEDVESFRRLIISWSRHKPCTTSSVYHRRDMCPWESPIQDRFVDPQFESFFLWSIWGSTSVPLPRGKPDVLHSLLVLCLAMHKDEENKRTSKGRFYLNYFETSYLKCLNDKFLHRVDKGEDETYIEFALDIDITTWNGFCCNDFFDMIEVSVGCTWTWRHIGESNWHKAADLEHWHSYHKRPTPSNRIPSLHLEESKSRIILRISANCFLDHLRIYLDKAQQFLRGIFGIHDTSPEFAELADLADIIRGGSRLDHDSIGRGCYMADVRTDGRVTSIRIV